MERIILKNKPKLIEWLDLVILQHAQAHELITTLQYNNIKVMKKQEGVTELLDTILGRGENTCRDFLEMLKEDDVNEISPQLREWIKTVDTKGTANMTGPSGTHVTCQKPDRDCERRPVQGTANMTGPSGTQVTCQKPDRDCERRPVQGYQKFLKQKTSKLVRNVKNIDAIIDDLNLHDESVAKVRANTTNQDKMRKLLDCMNCESIAEELFNALCEHEKGVMDELLNN